MPPLFCKNLLDGHRHTLSEPCRALSLGCLALPFFLDAPEILLAPLLDHLRSHVELIIDQELHIFDAKGTIAKF